ncbi:MAG: thiol:disulfide interchange protein [Mariniblastus sp.]|jgi:thiol:disulfide interchange protein
MSKWNSTGQLTNGQQRVSTGWIISAVVMAAVLLSTGCANSSRNLSLMGIASRSHEPLSSIPSAEPVKLTIWHDSYENAVAASRESGKPILADFTGSEWCSWCVKLKRDVFETPEFKAWARDNVVLLELDYPSPRKPAGMFAQQGPIQKQNAALKDRYSISSFPTVLMLNPNGDVLGKLGYKNSPQVWIAEAESKLGKGVIAKP